MTSQALYVQVSRKQYIRIRPSEVLFTQRIPDQTGQLRKWAITLKNSEVIERSSTPDSDRFCEPFLI